MANCASAWKNQVAGLSDQIAGSFTATAATVDSLSLDIITNYNSKKYGKNKAVQKTKKG